MQIHVSHIYIPTEERVNGMVYLSIAKVDKVNPHSRTDSYWSNPVMFQCTMSPSMWCLYVFIALWSAQSKDLYPIKHCQCRVLNKPAKNITNKIVHV